MRRGARPRGRAGVTPAAPVTGVGRALQPRGRESLHAPALSQAGRQHRLQPRGLRSSVQGKVGGGHGSLQGRGEAGECAARHPSRAGTRAPGPPWACPPHTQRAAKPFRRPRGAGRSEPTAVSLHQGLGNHASVQPPPQPQVMPVAWGPPDTHRAPCTAPPSHTRWTWEGLEGRP